MSFKTITLLLAIVFLTRQHVTAHELDSLRLEVREGVSFIIHQVTSKETLYGLSKRYGITIADIVKHNPGAENGLSIGQVLSIPYTRENGRVTHIVQQGETLYSISRTYNVTVDELKEWNNFKSNDLKLGQPVKIYPKVAVVQKKDEPEPVFNSGEDEHVVQAGETLFSISKKYDISVRKLRKLNDLPDNNISVGQHLALSKEKNSNENEQETVGKPVLQPVAESTSQNAPPPPPDTIYVSYRNNPKRIENASGFESIVQNGLAEVIENNTDTRKYLALHRDAPIGTLMQVRNEETGLRIFVRVIGRLPDTGLNEEILIKISKPAFDRLGAVNKRFPVVVSYVP